MSKLMVFLVGAGILWPIVALMVKWDDPYLAGLYLFDGLIHIPIGPFILIGAFGVLVYGITSIIDLIVWAYGKATN